MRYKGKQGWRNPFKSGGTSNLRPKQVEKILNYCTQNCYINLQNSLISEGGGCVKDWLKFSFKLHISLTPL